MSEMVSWWLLPTNIKLHYGYLHPSIPFHYLYWLSGKGHWGSWSQSLLTLGEKRGLSRIAHRCLNRLRSWELGPDDLLPLFHCKVQSRSSHAHCGHVRWCTGFSMDTDRSAATQTHTQQATMHYDEPFQHFVLHAAFHLPEKSDFEVRTASRPT